MNGYPDGTFRPGEPITRAEAIAVLDRAAGISDAAAAATVTYDRAGVYGGEDGTEVIDGSVTVSAAGVTLRNLTVNGNLLLAAAIGDGDVYLKNVSVGEEMTVRGGGADSVYLKDCTLGTVTVNKKGGNVRLVASGTTSVAEVKLDSGAVLEESGTAGPGFGRLTASGALPAGALVTLKGTFENVEVASPAGITVVVADGTTINTLTLDAPAEVTGRGTVEKAVVNAGGASFEQISREVELAAGVTATAGGEVISESSFGTGTVAAGGGSADTVPPRVTAATITVGGTERNIAIADGGRRGEIDLSGLDPATEVAAGSITVTEAATMVTTIKAGSFELDLEQNLEKGYNQLDAVSLFKNILKQEATLGILKLLVGNPVDLGGVLTDRSGNTADVSLLVRLP